MIRICLFLCVLFCGRISAQDTTGTAPTGVETVVAKGDTAVMTFCEIMPQFVGGQEAFTQYLQENIVYPKAERKAGKEGTVYVSFVVEKDGTISTVKLMKGVANAPGLGTEAVRVISAMPAWTPARMNSGAVRCMMTVPIKFVLSGKSRKKK